MGTAAPAMRVRGTKTGGVIIRADDRVEDEALLHDVVLRATLPGAKGKRVSLLKVLKERGYDVRTLRLSIQRRPLAIAEPLVLSARMRRGVRLACARCGAQYGLRYCLRDADVPCPNGGTMWRFGTVDGYECKDSTYCHSGSRRRRLSSDG
ncbi:hypothetical protein [Myxococcus phage Mx4 ts27htf-1hrm-1]|nr:hypothetical protein Mx4_p90 [Myxococcus phage Mx4]WNM70427.1 hypothetical protein [Myxococcus phage Mx4 ts27htf-1hrm-1]